MNHNFEKALNNSTELFDPIFVVGHPRSGTGLTVRSLGLSPSTCFLGETHVFRAYFSVINILSGIRAGVGLRLLKRPNPFFSGIKIKAKNFGSGENELTRLVKHLLIYCKLEKNYKLEPSNPLAEVMSLKLSFDEERQISEFKKKYRMLAHKNPDIWLRIMFKDCSIISNRKTVLEKTPFHVFCLPLISAVFPDAKVIIIRRKNIREVLASYCLMTKNVKLLPSMLDVYQKSNNIINKLLTEKNKNVLSIFYEDWVEDPGKTWQIVYEFSKLDPPVEVQKHINNIKRTPSKLQKISEQERKAVNDLANRFFSKNYW